MSSEFIGLVLLVVLLVINVQATRQIVRSGEQGFRKAMLMGGVWVVPFLGAWLVKTNFVTSAQRSDAGAQAAAEVLSVDLGRSVGALLGIDDNNGWAPDPARWGGAAA